MDIKIGAASVVIKDYIYFSACDFNGLMRTDIKTGKTEYICKFVKEENIEYVHSRAYVYRNEIWFVPGYGEYIACVNIETFDILYFELPYKSLGIKYKENPALNKNGRVRLKSLDSGKYGNDKIFVIVAGTDTIAVIDLINKKIIPYYDVIDPQTELMGYGAVHHDVLWMVPYSGEDLIALNLKNGTVTRVTKDPSLDDCKSLCCSEGKIWFVPRKTDYIVYYDMNENEYHKIYDEKGDLFNKDYWYKDIIEYKNEIWILPGDGKGIVAINPDVLMIEKKNYIFNFAHEIKIDTDAAKLYMVSKINSRISWIEDDEKPVSSVRIQISDKYFREILEKIYGENALSEYYKLLPAKISEKRIGLENFLFLIDEISYKEDERASKHIGMVVWKNTV